MKGLSKGEQSTLANPRLQLFVRNGGFLVDLYSGSYVIQDIRNADPSEKVTTTTIDAVVDRLGVGRYVIYTGSTAAWSLGTYRVVASFKLSATGPTHTQVIEFEILDAGDWVNGRGYVGYISTRKMLLDKVTTLPKMSLPEMHRLIREYSQAINQWTGRLGFHPVYTTIKVDGPGSLQLMLDEAIIALEGVASSDGDVYDSDAYSVFNRHLDGGPDDRYNPKVSRVDYTWASGRQNLQLTGVFGFTDPEMAEEGTEHTSLGYTPEELGRVISVLISRRLSDPQMTDPTVFSPGSVRSMKTRDQSVTLGGAAALSGSDGSMTGDPMLDQMLLRFVRPVFAAYAGGRPVADSEPWPWP